MTKAQASNAQKNQLYPATNFCMLPGNKGIVKRQEIWNLSPARGHKKYIVGIEVRKYTPVAARHSDLFNGLVAKLANYK
ncbi:hypothetical protein [Paraflavitalea sp. CAU 1676]|uniref:hypothetical protein n=1 Tax=Paraflavitalea sp. CAU 1676 TaxID=3032598 RepID=UPI0023DA616D|nr:hypothetical protein [Paraflavitalea sp. CAU 1676]MDF2187032.1 hypothetical protein [Paraflavitalea sp. CAU 1676]